ncbi:LVIVD repeat-containing protein [Seonamhaeicola marinus]|uniref:LVIVD repeat-containing protein n=1 Tax=Seonamhaeicola marinus TaxID=1912246 RepID=A0A5D0HVM7_9FLAO|nr:hypothetical protein [Seonamhaeicola marinus]TYA74890.1 hypothetical protein FUA24_16435 [Seonamhaeicola marinus]
MKTKHLLLSAFFLICLFSCNNNDDEDLDLVTVAKPEFVSKSQFRKMVDIKSPESIKQSGKIYAYGNYIFVNDLDRGVHIIDNQNPSNPQAIKFIKIPANEDISIKNNYLYADSATDLLVFDISNINNIQLVERLEDVFNIYDYRVPIEAVATDYGDFDWENDIIIGWELKKEKRENVDELIFVDRMFNDAVMAASVESAVGVGGSLARFQIVGTYLYTVGSYSMTVFNIQNLSNPVLEKTQHAGWNIETMFAANDYLYLGSTNGMYIYDLVNPASPEYVSDFTHWEGCDPVVVDGDYAYLTLRGGNLCGQLESVLEVIDISDKTQPTLAKRYTLENPYGLGIKGDMLFVCDGSAGLKLFDRETPVNLNLVRTIENIQATDVIPLPNSLVMIGDNTLYQYKYLENNISFLSSYKLN